MNGEAFHLIGVRNLTHMKKRSHEAPPCSTFYVETVICRFRRHPHHHLHLNPRWWSSR
jgi:hypothetical protein